MKFLSKYWFLFFGIAMAVFTFLYGQEMTSRDMQTSFAIRPHFMIQDNVYWMSSNPSSGPPSEDFKCVGTIEFMTDGYVSQNYEACGLLEGTSIYMNPQIPYQAYTDSWCYVTAEAALRCIRYHKGCYYDVADLYASGEYHDYCIKNEAEDGITEEVPMNAVYLGETNFEGYDVIPSQELGSNIWLDPCKVYQDAQNDDFIYCMGADDKIHIYLYVPVQY